MTGEELKELRKAKSLTQLQVAELTGVSGQKDIARYETNKVKITPPMAKLFKILLNNRVEYNDNSTFESNLFSKIDWDTDIEDIKCCFAYWFKIWGIE